MEVAELLGVYEVDGADRVVCRAAGYGRTVHKRIHVIRLAGALSVLGSGCYARLHGHTGSSSSMPRYGTAEGRRLTAEERELLRANTVAFVALIEAEHSAARDAEAAAQREQQVEQQRLAEQRAELERQELADRMRRAGTELPWTYHLDGPRPPAGSPAAKLARFRAQMQAQAARLAVQHLPQLERYGLPAVAEAMVEAKVRCLGQGLKLETPGSLQEIEREALAILTSGQR